MCVSQKFKDEKRDNVLKRNVKEINITVKKQIEIVENL